MNQEKFKKNKAVFFDRDGVLNLDYGYLHKIKDFKWVDGAKESIKFLNKFNYIVIVVTNQSGVSRGFYREEDINKLHGWMNEELSKINARIDDFFYSIELPGNDKKKFSRRKPSPKMINEAIIKYNLERKDCFLIGDKQTDLEAAKNAKIKGFLFDSKNLYELVKRIIKNKTTKKNKLL